MMLSYNEAQQSVQRNVQALAPCEWPTANAGGLILAKAASASWDMPRFDSSAMDGYAFAGQSYLQKGPLQVIGASYAGHPFTGTLAKGEAIRIATGAALPIGADTVVPIEDADEDEGRLRVEAPFTTGQHIRQCGEEFKAGETLLQAGVKLQAGEIGLLACAGVARVWVYPRPRVAIISTGDELVELGGLPGAGQIINSNLHFLATRLRECGCEPVCIGISSDNLTSMDSCVSQALSMDMVLSTGGVSVGEKDQVQTTLSRRRFHKFFWKVAIKPGKPLLFGLLEDKPFFGLPGNPAATAATFELFVKPALRKMAGYKEPALQKRSGILTESIHGGGKRVSFIWCRLEWCKDHYEVVIRSHQGSDQNRSIQGANALLAIPLGTTGINRGEKVEVFMIEP